MRPPPPPSTAYLSTYYITSVVVKNSSRGEGQFVFSLLSVEGGDRSCSHKTSYYNTREKACRLPPIKPPLYTFNVILLYYYTKDDNKSNGVFGAIAFGYFGPSYPPNSHASNTVRFHSGEADFENQQVMFVFMIFYGT